MAQFDFYPNPHPGSRRFVPYVVDVQSPLIGEQLTLVPHLAAPLAQQHLKHPEGSLTHHTADIMAAMDGVLSGS